MLTNANVLARINELQAELSAGVIALEISDRNARVKALQDRRDLMRVNWPRPFRRLLAGSGP